MAILEGNFYGSILKTLHMQLTLGIENYTLVNYCFTCFSLSGSFITLVWIRIDIRCIC